MNPEKQHIPIVAVTMGDPAGIGPEITAKAFTQKVLYAKCRPLLIGHSPTLYKVLKDTGMQTKIQVIGHISEARFRPGIIDVLEACVDYTDPVQPGRISAAAGDIAFKSVTTAIDLALKGLTDATVTGPINKEALHCAGHNFSGHTEIFARFTHTKKYAMLLIDEGIRVIHATTHVSLREACDLIKKERVLEVIHLLNEGLKKLGFTNPRIGVAGLNPHSGDGGLFGREEAEEIRPAVEEARTYGINAAGPVPADTLFVLARGGQYDGCVAMYHDQGHIPFKLLCFSWDKRKGTMKSVSGINITLGLPIIRTSVDHGTAFEIAGKGLADPGALMQAIDYAIRLLK